MTCITAREPELAERGLELLWDVNSMGLAHALSKAHTVGNERLTMVAVDEGAMVAGASFRAVGVLARDAKLILSYLDP